VVGNRRTGQTTGTAEPPPAKSLRGVLELVEEAQDKIKAYHS